MLCVTIVVCVTQYSEVYLHTPQILLPWDWTGKGLLELFSWEEKVKEGGKHQYFSLLRSARQIRR